MKNPKFVIGPSVNKSPLPVVWLLEHHVAYEGTGYQKYFAGKKPTSDQIQEHIVFCRGDYGRLDEEKMERLLDKGEVGEAGGEWTLNQIEMEDNQ